MREAPGMNRAEFAQALASGQVAAAAQEADSERYICKSRATYESSTEEGVADALTRSGSLPAIEPLASQTRAESSSGYGGFWRDMVWGDKKP